MFCFYKNYMEDYCFVHFFFFCREIKKQPCWFSWMQEIPQLLPATAASSQCGPSDAFSGSPLDWSSFRTGCSGTVSPPCGPSCVYSDRPPAWNASRTARSRTVSLPCGSAGGFSSCWTCWSSSRTRRTRVRRPSSHAPAGFACAGARPCWFSRTPGSCAGSDRGWWRRARRILRQHVARVSQRTWEG